MGGLIEAPPSIYDQTVTITHKQAKTLADLKADKDLRLRGMGNGLVEVSEPAGYPTDRSFVMNKKGKRVEIR